MPWGGWSTATAGLLGCRAALTRSPRSSVGAAAQLCPQRPARSPAQLLPHFWGFSLALTPLHPCCAGPGHARPAQPAPPRLINPPGLITASLAPDAPPKPTAPQPGVSRGGGLGPHSPRISGSLNTHHYLLIVLGGEQRLGHFCASPGPFWGDVGDFKPTGLEEEEKEEALVGRCV